MAPECCGTPEGTMAIEWRTRDIWVFCLHALPEWVDRLLRSCLPETPTRGKVPRASARHVLLCGTPRAPSRPIMFTLEDRILAMTDDDYLFVDLRHLGAGLRLAIDPREILPMVRHVAYTSTRS